MRGVETDYAGVGTFWLSFTETLKGWPHNVLIFPMGSITNFWLVMGWELFDWASQKSWKTRPHNVLIFPMGSSSKLLTLFSTSCNKICKLFLITFFFVWGLPWWHIIVITDTCSNNIIYPEPKTTVTKKKQNLLTQFAVAAAQSKLEAPFGGRHHPQQQSCS